MPQKLAGFLKERRRLAGLSQKAVQIRLGYTTPQFISNWERGISQPPFKTLRRLGDLYRISADELFDIVLEDGIEKESSRIYKAFYGKSKVKQRA